jgi:hypothetical protein
MGFEILVRFAASVAAREIQGTAIAPIVWALVYPVRAYIASASDAMVYVVRVVSYSGPSRLNQSRGNHGQTRTALKMAP